MKEIRIEKKDEDQRLDKYLKKLLRNASSGFLYKMLRKKNIVLNDKKADGSEIVKEGDSIKLYLSDETFEKFSGSDASQNLLKEIGKLPFDDISIVYEDDDILAANKPAGLLSQGNGNLPSLNEKLISYLYSKGEITEESFKVFRPSVQNRIDRNTTGIVLFAKTLKGAKLLSEEIKERKIEKYYTCTVHGKAPDDLSGELFLKKDESTNTVSISKEKMPGYVPVRTDFKVLSYTKDSDTTYIEAKLYTGKTHQIRATLSFLGYPIVGDAKYGNVEKDRKLKIKKNRMYLHAKRIVLSDGREFTAPEPE